MLVEYDYGEYGAQDGREGHGPYSGAYRGRRIARQSRRRTRRRRQVEGYYVDGDICGLQRSASVGHVFSKNRWWWRHHRLRRIVVMAGGGETYREECRRTGRQGRRFGN